MTSVSVKRIYEPVSGDDGLRILVDRLWPRGVAKDKARIDLWLKEVAPSNALRKRMHGLPLAWEEFVAEYGRELEQEPARTALRDLRERIATKPATLLYAARDESHNNAVALLGWLKKRNE
jgi:uncharacterized protein YeaO (DUF488 family)